MKALRAANIACDKEIRAKHAEDTDIHTGKSIWD